MSEIILSTNIERSAKVMMIESMFDIEAQGLATTKIIDNIPDLSQRDWNIGLIVGASGSGKSTTARKHFGELVDPVLEWDNNKAIVDHFPSTMSLKDVAMILSSVGFSSPPAWLRPYETLSTGEKFRVSIARLLCEHSELVVVDEFTSVIDRTVAKIGSVAIAKAVRERNQKFVAVSCHYDIKEWLTPDWTYEPATGVFRWESLQRPKVDIVVRRCHRSSWSLFARHHYLNQDNVTSWTTYVAFYEGQPAALCSVLPFPHAKVKSGRRIARIVTLPDYQGIGIGAKLSALVGGAYSANGNPVYAVTSHPAVIKGYNSHPAWAMIRKPSRVGTQGKTSTLKGKIVSSTSRMTATFKYVGEPDFEARKLLPDRD